MLYVHSRSITNIQFDTEDHPERPTVLEVSNDIEEVRGLLNIASEKRVSRVQRIKFVRNALDPVNSDFDTIGLRDALRLVEACEANPYS